MTPEAPGPSMSERPKKVKRERASPTRENASRARVKPEAVSTKKRKSNLAVIDSSDEDMDGLTAKERAEFSRLKVSTGVH